MDRESFRKQLSNILSDVDPITIDHLVDRCSTVETAVTLYFKQTESNNQSNNQSFSQSSKMLKGQHARSNHLDHPSKADEILIDDSDVELDQAVEPRLQLRSHQSSSTSQSSSRSRKQSAKPGRSPIKRSSKQSSQSTKQSKKQTSKPVANEPQRSIATFFNPKSSQSKHPISQSAAQSNIQPIDLADGIQIDSRPDISSQSNSKLVEDKIIESDLPSSRQSTDPSEDVADVDQTDDQSVKQSINPTSTQTVLDISSVKRIITTQPPCWLADQSNNRPVNSVANPGMFSSQPIKESNSQTINQSIPFLHIARFFAVIESESSRIIILNFITLMFAQILEHDRSVNQSINQSVNQSNNQSINHSSDLLRAVYLSINQFAPVYENLQLNVGGSMLAKSIKEVTGQSINQALYQQYGDLGEIALINRSNQSMLVEPSPLSVKKVFDSIKSLATIGQSDQSNNQSNNQSNKKHKTSNQSVKPSLKRLQTIKHLLLCSREHESKFIIRLIEQANRIGASRKSVLSGLARAVVLLAHFRAEAIYQSNKQPDNQSSNQSGNQSNRQNLVTWDRILAVTEKDCPTRLNLLINQSNIQTNGHACSFLKDQSISEPLSRIANQIQLHSLHACIQLANQSIDQAINQHPNIELLIDHILSSDLAIYQSASCISFVAGVPCRPMLGKTSSGVLDMLKKLIAHSNNKASKRVVNQSNNQSNNQTSEPPGITLELKYDGMRAQIHRFIDHSVNQSAEQSAKPIYRVFSRHLIDQANRWEDVCSAIEQAINQPSDQANIQPAITSFVLDVELVAIKPSSTQTSNRSSHQSSNPIVEVPNTQSNDPTIVSSNEQPDVQSVSRFHFSESVTILPFQAITTRKRKIDETIDQSNNHSNDQSVRVMCFAFDLLYLNGVSLLDRPFVDRRRLLYQSFNPTCERFGFVESIDISIEHATYIVREAEIEGEASEQPNIEPNSQPAKNSSKSQSNKQSSSKQSNRVTTKPSKTSKQPSKQTTQRQARHSNQSFTDQPISDDFDDPADILDVSSGDDDDEDDIIGLTLDQTSNQPNKQSRSQTASQPDLTESQISIAQSSYQTINQFLFSRAFKCGEGVMCKRLDSLYQPDCRSDDWIKLKRDYIQGLSVVDSVDCVPIGAWWGNGRKAGWYSPVLLAVYNSELDRYETLCKCMSGFSDVRYVAMLEELKPYIRDGPRSDYHVTDSLTPSTWFEPKVVWEIRGADLTISPNHTAAIGDIDEERGISLRFPRYIRDRPDKRPEDATTSQQIAEWFLEQSNQSSSNHSKRGR